MSQQLVYTSATKGLKLGSRGFCTVASTPGMAKNLADRLESLSGYRHIHAPGTEKASLNPVNFSYVKFKLGGQTYQVVSRVGDAGLDHTHRSNKLAHHIALAGNELVSEGPASFASRAGNLLTKWEGDARHLPASANFSTGVLEPRVCQAWQQASGDAGWAGVLAHQLTSSNGEAYMVYPLGMQVLPLVVEAQALLPAEQRWLATFSTFYTKLPPGVECRWRFVADGTPEAIQARRSAGMLVIDLTQQGKKPIPANAASNPLVELARTGVRQTPVAKPKPVAPTSAQPTEPEPLHANLPLATPLPDSLDQAEIGLEASPPTLPQQRRTQNSGQLSSPGQRDFPIWLIAAAVMMLVAGVGVLGYFFGTMNRGEKPTVAEVKAEKEQEQKPQSPKDELRTKEAVTNPKDEDSTTTDDSQEEPNASPEIDRKEDAQNTPIPEAKSKNNPLPVGNTEKEKQTPTLYDKQFTHNDITTWASKEWVQLGVASSEIEILLYGIDPPAKNISADWSTQFSKLDKHTWELAFGGATTLVLKLHDGNKLKGKWVGRDLRKAEVSAAGLKVKDLIDDKKGFITFSKFEEIEPLTSKGLKHQFLALAPFLNPANDSVQATISLETGDSRFQLERNKVKLSSARNQSKVGFVLDPKDSKYVFRLAFKLMVSAEHKLGGVYGAFSLNGDHGTVHGFLDAREKEREHLLRKAIASYRNKLTSELRKRVYREKGFKTAEEYEEHFPKLDFDLLIIEEQRVHQIGLKQKKRLQRSESLREHEDRYGDLELLRKALNSIRISIEVTRELQPFDGQGDPITVPVLTTKSK